MIKLLLTTPILLSGLTLGGCATEVAPSPTEMAVAPSIAALSSYEASVGTLVEVYGSGFPARGDGETLLVFQGSYDTADGSYDVDQEFSTRFSDASTLRWDSLGPFRVPFGVDGNQVGGFTGTILPRAMMNDGQVIDGEPVDIDFEVKPSIIVHELQPLAASCGAPITRALDGASYRMRVEAIGFEPESFTYTVSVPGINDVDSVSVRHVAQGPFDSIGENGDFAMPRIPPDQLSYGAVLSVQAVDTQGRVHATAFGVEVHRPLEFFYNGNVEVAEVLAPTPVSACIPGGEAGRAVSYTESTTETFSRGYNVGWNESWLNSHTVSSSSSETVGLSERNGVGFATTDGESVRWTVGGEVGGTIGIGEAVSIGLKGKFERSSETNRSVQNSENRETGIDSSSTTTDTDAVTESNTRAASENFAWNVSSSETIATGFGGTVIAGTYGVFYRQALRLIRRGVVIAYNQCGSAEAVADVDFIDWTWAPDLALGDSCPPLPMSNLPEAECILSPCQGE